MRFTQIRHIQKTITFHCRHWIYSTLTSIGLNTQRYVVCIHDIFYKATKTKTAELPQPWEWSMNCRFQEDYSYKFQLDDKTLHNSCRWQRKRTRQGIFRMQDVPLQIIQRFPLTWSLIYTINYPLYRRLNNTNKEASWK